MEYVEGQPIDDLLRHARAEHLRAPRAVSQGLLGGPLRAPEPGRPPRHQAGQRVVTSDGTPKLLDFGIAKLLNPELAGQTIAPTAAGLHLMTPEYASPEQVRGEPVTTASDIYSLGILLYELITGRRPYRLTSRAPAELVQVICHATPLRPSTAVTATVDAGAESTTSPEGDATTVHLTPLPINPTPARAERLKRRLAGDLDTIVLKALSKEPDRRYTSVDQFSEDIRRHLVGLPVIARKDTLRYRGSKFVQRNRAIVAAGAIAFLALIAAVGVTTWQARVASRQRELAEQRFNDVRVLANTFLFDLHDAIRDLPGSTPARQMLVTRGLEYLDKLAGEAGGAGRPTRPPKRARQRLRPPRRRAGAPVQPEPGRHQRRAGQLPEGGRAPRGHRRQPGRCPDAARSGNAYLRSSSLLSAIGDTKESLGRRRMALLPCRPLDRRRAGRRGIRREAGRA